MARVPMTPPPNVEALLPWAEEWFDEQDVRDALGDGVRGDALAHRLSELAGARYADALREQAPHAAQRPTQGGVVSERPAVRRNPAISAARWHRFTGRCQWQDKDRFLTIIDAW